MLKIIIGTNEGKVLCISNNEDEIKASMVNYLIDTDQEPTEDFFESRNWGEYDIEVYEYHQPQLNENQQIVLEWLKANVDQDNASPMCSIFLLGSLWESRKFNIQEDIAIDNAYSELSYKQQAQVLEVFSRWALEQEEE